MKIDDIVCAVDGQDIRHGPPSLVLQLTNGNIGTSMCLHVIRKESADDEIAGALSARGETKSIRCPSVCGPLLLGPLYAASFTRMFLYVFQT